MKRYVRAVFCILTLPLLVSCRGGTGPAAVTPPVEVELIDTFGPGDTYNVHSGWTLGHDGDVVSIHAIGFTPATSGTVSRYTIAVFRNSGGDQLDAWLLDGSDAQPGDVIEAFSFAVPAGSSDLVVTADSTASPLLLAGTRYWLLVAPPDPSSELFGWYRNPPVSGVLNAWGPSTAGPFNVLSDQQAPTLRIVGEAD